MKVCRSSTEKLCRLHWKSNMIILIEFILGGRKNMVDLYCALIIAEKRTFDSVPKRYQEAVREQLAAIGLDENGNPIE